MRCLLTEAWYASAISFGVITASTAAGAVPVRVMTGTCRRNARDRIVAVIHGKHEVTRIYSYFTHAAPTAYENCPCRRWKELEHLQFQGLMRCRCLDGAEILPIPPHPTTCSSSLVTTYLSASNAQVTTGRLRWHHFASPHQNAAPELQVAQERREYIGKYTVGTSCGERSQQTISKPSEFTPRYYAPLMNE